MRDIGFRNGQYLSQDDHIRDRGHFKSAILNIFDILLKKTNQTVRLKIQCTNMIIICFINVVENMNLIPTETVLTFSALKSYLVLVYPNDEADNLIWFLYTRTMKQI